MFEPIELVEKLAALVPPPRFHMVRYHGVLAPRARGRERITPSAVTMAAVRGAITEAQRPAYERRSPLAPSRPRPTETPPRITRPTTTLHPTAPQAPRNSPHARGPGPATSTASTRPHKRLSWPELMQRVFAIDVLRCPECGGSMRIIAEIHPPDTTRAILECVGLPARAPPPAPAERNPAELAFDPFEPA